MANAEKSNQVLQQHFEQVAEKFLQQTAAGISVLLTENKSSIDKKTRNIQLQSYLNNLAKTDFIKQIHLYDKTGSLLLKSESSGEASASIKLLYGIDESLKTLDKSKQYVPFIQELRTEKLVGYVRLTVEKYHLTSAISKNSDESQTLSRLLLIIAVIPRYIILK